MILIWILNTFSGDLTTSVVYITTTKDVWDVLREHFSQQNVSRLFEIQCDLARLKQSQQPINVYFTKLKGLWDEMDSYQTLKPCSCGAVQFNNEQVERTKVLQILMGLDNSYSAIHRKILLIQLLPSIRSVYSMLAQEEKQRGMVAGPSLIEPVAMVVQTSRGNSSNNGKGKSFERKPLHCSYCDEDHHSSGSSSSGGHDNKPSDKLAVNNVASTVAPSMPNLTTEQFQQLLSMMSQMIGLDSKANVAGSGDEDDDWLGATTWIEEAHDVASSSINPNPCEVLWKKSMGSKGEDVRMENLLRYQS
ncbi:uncharacterized protein [Pyrus communis]|uniref:uncharacterized protein n=1 Tax=Pyrus communis TaxID=23211 RepID=UPI0035BF05D6